jgi:hypothetical protein
VNNAAGNEVSSENTGFTCAGNASEIKPRKSDLKNSIKDVISLCYKTHWQMHYHSSRMLKQKEKEPV